MRIDDVCPLCFTIIVAFSVRLLYFPFAYLLHLAAKSKRKISKQSVHTQTFLMAKIGYCRLRVNVKKGVRFVFHFIRVVIISMSFRLSKRREKNIDNEHSADS